MIKKFRHHHLSHQKIELFEEEELIDGKKSQIAGGKKSQSYGQLFDFFYFYSVWFQRFNQISEYFVE